MAVGLKRIMHLPGRIIHFAIAHLIRLSMRQFVRKQLRIVITANSIPIFSIRKVDVADAQWLQAEMERQALEKYVTGDYILGRLNKEGQRISIHIEIPRRNGDGMVSFISGWMVRPDGLIRLITPYGGK